MTRFLLILGLLLLSGRGASAFDAEFDQAQAAYDSGRYAEAVQIYQNMLSNGVDNAEVYYNLANASFRDGDLPQAVWNYRKAWYSAPRDPDIRDNLHYALNAAGAVESQYPPFRRVLMSFSSGEWIRIAAGSYVVLSIFILLAMLIRGARAVLARLCLLPLGVLVIALGGWWTWRALRNQPEGVIATSGITALYGPVAGTMPHYKLPAGALVRQSGTDPKGWVEIEYDGKKGWINQSGILILSP